jgi:hypothetical protein
MKKKTGKNPNLIHGTVESCKSMNPNHVTGPANGSVKKSAIPGVQSREQSN